MKKAPFPYYKIYQLWGRFIRFFFLRDHFLLSVMIMLVTGLFYLSVHHLNFHIFDPIENALKNFEFSDIYYSDLITPEKNGEQVKDQRKLDTTIFLVNIAGMNREAIAQVVDTIKKYHPKVLALDISFSKQNAPGSEDLTESLQNIPGLIFALDVRYNDKEEIEFVPQNLKLKGNLHKYGHVYLGDGGVIRNYYPKISVKGKVYNAFASQIAATFDSNKYKILQERNNSKEVLNYTFRRYQILDSSKFLDKSRGFSWKSIQNKIIILGQLSGDNDRHTTPLRFNTDTTRGSFGKYLAIEQPDMYGPEIHAQAVSMILDENYINLMPGWLGWIFAFIILYIHVVVFNFWYVKKHKWFHMVAKIVQLISTIILAFIFFYLYHSFNFKVYWAPTLLSVALAVDVMYFYDGLVKYLNHKWHFKTYYLEH